MRHVIDVLDCLIGPLSLAAFFAALLWWTGFFAR